MRIAIAAIVLGLLAPACAAPAVSLPPPSTESAQPPAPLARALWVPGHWRKIDRGFVWIEGHWA